MLCLFKQQVGDRKVNDQGKIRRSSTKYAKSVSTMDHDVKDFCYAADKSQVSSGKKKDNKQHDSMATK